MIEQTISIEPRATFFTQVCEACEEELPDGQPWATVRGSLALDEGVGWAICRRGHTMRVVRRVIAAVPAGAPS